MQNFTLHDYGVPIKRAAEISGWEGSAFPTLLFKGLFGPAPAEPVSRASLVHVAAATVLKQAESAGISREQVSLVLMEVADAVYVRLAMAELSERRWHPATCGTRLLEKLRSGDCQFELEQMLGVRSGNTKQFAVFGPEGPTLTNSLPDSGDGLPLPHLDAWRIARLIRVRVTDLLFY